MNRKYAIVGVGETEVGRLHGQSTQSLHLRAAAAAIEDASLAKSDVDGLLTNQPIHDPMRSYSAVLMQALGLNVTYMTDLGLGGATPVAMAQHAAMAIEAGLCEAVLCVHARNQATKRELPYRGRNVRDGEEDFDEPYGILSAVANHAFIASRHMALYGTTSEQLGAVAIAAREHASLTPSATMRKPITLGDHQASRWIVEPLHLLDCSLLSDGGAAFIVTSRERARDLRHPPVYICGFGQSHPSGNLAQAAEIATLGGGVSSTRAYSMAGVTPEDIQFAEIYDCFTITTLVTLEDYGFCPKGEGGPWVADGNIKLGGRLPVNTHGGLLSHAHLEGMAHITEAVKQLRHSVEPERQVQGASLGIVSGHGGAGSMHSTIILGS